VIDCRHRSFCYNPPLSATKNKSTILVKFEPFPSSFDWHEYSVLLQRWSSDNQHKHRVVDFAPQLIKDESQVKSYVFFYQRDRCSGGNRLPCEILAQIIMIKNILVAEPREKLLSSLTIIDVCIPDTELATGEAVASGFMEQVYYILSDLGVTASLMENNNRLLASINRLQRRFEEAFVCLRFKIINNPTVDLLLMHIYAKSM
jgi:hypothetical protein